MNNVTIVVHSYSSNDLTDCLQSAFPLTSNIMVVGDEKRPEILKKMKMQNIKYIPFTNCQIVEPARSFAVQQVKTDWVFIMDVDERITPHSVKEITAVIKKTSDSFFQIPRKEIIFRKFWLSHGGWWPNYQTRLIRVKDFVSWPTHIHATPVIRGKQGKLTEPLLHYSQNDIAELVARTIIFEDKESDLLSNAKKSVNTLTFFRKFTGELFRRLIKWQGFRDGTVGVIESVYQAFSKTITYIFLYEKNRAL